MEANPDPVFNGWHPSPEAHKAWAEELVRYINENKLLSDIKHEIKHEEFSNMRRFI